MGLEEQNKLVTLSLLIPSRVHGHPLLGSDPTDRSVDFTHQ